MTDQIRAILVEDERAVRAQLSRLLQAPPFDLLAAVGTLAEAREACARLQPQVLITDLRLPDGHGLTLIRETRANLPATRIMVISVLADEESVVAAIRAGADGYLLKDERPELFVSAIEQLMQGYSNLSPAIAQYIVRQMQAGEPAEAAASAAALTPRELAVLGYIAKGLGNVDIATRLDISVHTVGAHVKNIYRKLEVKTRGEAVFQGINLQLLGP